MINEILCEIILNFILKKDREKDCYRIGRLFRRGINVEKDGDKNGKKCGLNC